ncbi:MAG: type II toxin-antitoxin system VapC family toxin [Nitrososphaerales archaeon]
MIYVDSNYWIYWLDSRLPEHESVLGTMRKAIKEGIATNYVTLFEVAHYLRMLPKQDFSDLMERIQSLATLRVFDLDRRIADAALKMVPEYAPVGLGSRDCVILATMRAFEVHRIATHDRAFRRVPWVEAIDDVSEKGSEARKGSRTGANPG